MAWRTVVITKHAKVNYKMNHLVVQTDEDVYQIPIDDVQVVVITTTRAVITTYAIAEIIKRNVKIIFSDTNGAPIGEINAYHNNGKRNRNIQKQINWSQEHKDTLWTLIVKHKLNNQYQLLTEFGVSDIQTFAQLVDTVEIGDQTNREAVAARMYFPRLFDKSFVRHADGIENAMLDYGYSILLSAVSREIAAQGYLTELGIHHDGALNDYNLASDLMEIFRPEVDRIVKITEKATELDLEAKLALIDVLNQSVSYNGEEVLLTHAIETVVRTSVAYLNEEVELPDWSFEI